MLLYDTKLVVVIVCLLSYYPTCMVFWHFPRFQDIALQDPLFTDEMSHHSQVSLDILTCPKVTSEGDVVELQFDEQLLLC